MDDLMHLFLYVRDRSDGRESIREIGDFCAHQGERNKGTVTRSVRELFFWTHFWATTKKDGITIDALPPFIKSHLQGSLRKLPDSTLKLHGTSKVKCTTAINRVLKSMVEQEDKTFTLYDPARGKVLISESDLKAFTLVCGILVTVPAFSGERLVLDLAGCLRSNSILRKEEAREFQTLGPFIQLFALSMMHKTEIVTPNDGRVLLHLEFGSDRHGRKLSIGSPILSPDSEPGRPIFYSTPVFTTDLNSDQYCDPLILKDEHSAVQHYIEVGPEQKLVLL